MVSAPPAERAVSPSLLAHAEADGRPILLEPEVYALLAGGGICVPAHAVVKGAAEVDAALCARIPSAEVVVKIVSPDLLHKSDVGGVAMAANTVAEVRAAVDRVLAAAAKAAPSARIDGALVAEKVPHRSGLGWEVLAGFRHDPAFGPVVVVGVGGLDTEYLLASLRPERARAVRPAAGLDEAGILAMLRGGVVHDTLCGQLRSSRGVAVEEPRLAALVAALARLAEQHAGFAPADGLGLSELEVNPFVVAGDGRLVAIDGLARLHRPQPLPRPRPVQQLRALLEPRSAVVVGASAEGTNAGRIILRNLLEGGGIAPDRLYAVHPRAQAIDGCRAVPSLAQLPETVDLAVVAVGADRGGEAVMEELVRGRRARTVTLISGGFGETEAGRAAEQRLRALMDAAHAEPDGGVLVNGGNCLGIVSVPGRYNTFFLPPYKLPFNDAPGDNVASISQSGAYLVTQVSNLDRSVRPRYAISFGNQMDVTVSDYLEYLAGDEAVQVFATYVEGFARGDGQRFLEQSRRLVGSGRTVLLYKAGRTPEGGAAAASHTASAVGDYEVCRELVASAGVIECATLDMLEDFLMTFSFLARRPSAGSRIAVLSNAGFECTAAADKLYGLELADLEAGTRERIKRLLPSGLVDVHNPVDATPMTPTENYAACVEALEDDPGVDALVVAGVPATPYVETLAAGAGHAEDLSRPTSLPSRLIEIFRSSSKPMVFSVDSGALYDPCVQMLKRAGLPCFRKVDRATRALSAFVRARR